MFEFSESKKAGFDYALFPYFERRIEELREYMDMCNSRSRNLLDLMRTDNPTVFYPIFVAFVLGVFSITVSLLSLIASIIQAWASVKALPPR